MPGSFLPDKDQALLAWALNFSTKLSLSPLAYGATVAEAAAFAVLYDSFASAMAAADPAIRNKPATAAKNAARLALKISARDLAKRIEGFSVTDAQLLELGLTVRATPSPIPVPAVVPALDINEVVGRNVRIRLHDAANPGKRGKPPGCKGAMVYSFVGPAMPTEVSDLKFEGYTTRPDFAISFPESVAPGTTVWFAACWTNEKGQNGNLCEPVSAMIQFGLSAAA